MRRLVVAVSSAAVVLGGLVFAPSSAASPTTVSVTCDFFGLHTSPTAVSATSGDIITLHATNPGTFSATLLGVTGSSTFSIAADENYTVTSSSGGSITISTGMGLCASQTAVLTIVGPSPSPSGGSASQESTAVIETLALAVEANGASCTGGSPTGYAGAWLTLPSADQCTQTGPTAKAGATLLGWSTNANFPVALAQSQVDKHWGAIDDTFDGVRMIFIPAGMATFVSGSNTLYPIWSA